MYVVIRKFNRMRSVAEAARRAESGLGQMLKQTPGFQGYCVFDAGEGAVDRSVCLRTGRLHLPPTRRHWPGSGRA